jgi:hypothetical protein
LSAAALAVFTIGFMSARWLPPDTGPANLETRAAAGRASLSGSIHPKPVDPGTATIGSDGQENSRESLRASALAQLAALRTQDDFEFTFKELDNRSAPPPAPAPFGERFSFDEPSAPNRFSQPSNLSASADALFGGEASAPGTGVPSAAAAPRAAAPRVAAAVPAPRPAARSVVAQVEPKPAAPKPAPATGFRLASASDTSLPLGYAPSDPVKSSLIPGSTSKDPASKDPLSGIDPSHTAIYDISARTVYLPNGRRLEAHSGFGDQMDDVRYVNQRMTGPTPPNVYELKMREELFHGVRAIRLIPTDGAKMYGRAGILAHSYLLGPNGQSNGCVSFSDYTAFLDAFMRGDINRIVVVERLADPPPPQAVSDWFTDKFKDFFRRS